MRKAASLLLVIFVVLVAGWSAAWFAASIYASHEVDSFIKAEARQGRFWTCPDRRTFGFPTAIAISCRDATYAGQAEGQRVEGQVAGIVATVTLAAPRRFAIVLASPFSYKSSDGQTGADATWHSLAFDLLPLPNPRTLTLHGTDVVVHGRVPDAGEGGGRAATLDASFTASPPMADRTVDFALTMTRAPMPILDDLIGGDSAPIDAAFTGRLDQADAGEARTPAEVMERWRENDGTISLSSLRVNRGGASVTASGVLGLDDEHRPKGRLNASFVGLEPILARYGISGDVAALGSLLGTFFGGDHPAKPTTPGALALPINFRNGRLGIGPITTEVKLSPLY